VITAVGIGFAVGKWGIVGAAAVTTASQVAYLLYVALAVRRPMKVKGSPAATRAEPEAGPVPDAELAPA
jgi:hypothetical protein